MVILIKTLEGFINMDIYICFYTNKKFRSRESILIDQFSNCGFSNILPYRSEDVKSGKFYEENKELLDCEIGDGYWLWKPKILLDSFENMNYGDVLVYTDSGDQININEDIIKKYSINNDYYFTNWSGVRWEQKICTKRDCFILMDCDSEKYHNTSQMEAGFLIFKKTETMIELLKEYLHFCSIKEIVDNEPNTHGEDFLGWQFHRNDQSILTNLIVKYELNFSNHLDNYIKNNIFIP
jgi:hypothetical protein